MRERTQEHFKFRPRTVFLGVMWCAIVPAAYYFFLKWECVSQPLKLFIPSICNLLPTHSPTYMVTVHLLGQPPPTLSSSAYLTPPPTWSPSTYLVTHHIPTYHLPTCLLPTHPPTHSHSHSFTFPSTHSFTLTLPAHTPTHPPTFLPTYSSTHPPTHPPSHLFIYPLTLPHIYPSTYSPPAPTPPLILSPSLTPYFIISLKSTDLIFYFPRDESTYFLG